MAFNTLEALQAFGLGQQMSQQKREAERKEQLREELTQAYDPNTGQVDPARARQAYVGAGDIEGAMGFDQAYAGIQEKVSARDQERIRLGSRLLANVTDEASYQAARRAADSAGIELGDEPESYDPQWVEGVKQIGSVLEQVNAKQGEGFTLNPGAIRYGPNGQVLAKSPYDPIVESGGVIYSRPPSGPAQPPQGAQSMEQMAEAAIAAGADPAAVRARLQQMQGGAGPQGPQTFP